MNRAGSRSLRWGAFGATIVFWIFGVALPLAGVGVRLSGDPRTLWDPEIRDVAWLTARQAALSTGISAVIGLPLGLAAARVSGRVARFLEALLLLPQTVPTVVAATAWIAWLGRSGVLARWGLSGDLAYRLEAVILAHVFFNAPWIALGVAHARRSVSRAALESAATLGAGTWARLRFVVWPGIRAALGAAAAQVFALCSMSFALVLILGGGPPVETLETAMYSRLRGGSLELSAAAACALWELGLTLLPWGLVLWLRRRGGATASLGTTPETRTREDSSSLRESPRVSRALIGAAILVAGVFLLPYCLVFGQLSAWLSPEFWAEVATPLQVSFGIAASASLGSVTMALIATLASTAIPRASIAHAVFEAILVVPSGVSVLVLGLGTWLVYGQWIDPFDGSLAAIIGLQVVVFFPTAFRSLWPLAQRSRRAALEVAWTLGASEPRAFWWVEWPRWRGPVFSVLALIAGLALGEVAAVSLFYSEHLVPLPLLVSRWMGQYRFEEARAVSALLLACAALLIFGVSWGESWAWTSIKERDAHAAGV